MVVGSVMLALIWWALAHFTHHCWTGAAVLPVWLWLFAFFRDPERPIPAEPNLMVSPADGTVSDITDMDNVEALGGPALRIGIFLSVFSVHVNRAPCDAKVLSVAYKKGRFINAINHHQASEHNEATTIVLADPATGKPIAVVRQIVGLIARRIVCEAAPGAMLKRGQRIGMIKFGSRTELIVPKWMNPAAKVRIGQKVRGAMDVVATVRME
ncbi:MAG: phosphatidylserine decarboxylase [Tepidisphaerales bacterium]